MKTLIQQREMEEINSILSTMYMHLPVNLNDLAHNTYSPSENFINKMCVQYRANYASVYKQVLDYCYSREIDFFQIFDTVRLNNPRNGFSYYPEYLELLAYGAKKGYLPKSHDLSKYFVSFQKENKTSLSHQIKLLPFLPIEYKSFLIHCFVFDKYLKALEPQPLPEGDQKKICEMFKRFEKQSYYKEEDFRYKKFFPSLLKLEEEELSTLSQASFFSCRFSFSYTHSVPTVAKTIEHTLSYAYSNIFSNLQERKLIEKVHAEKDKTSLIFYLHGQSQDTLEHIKQAVSIFHQAIQPELQFNQKMADYYLKLFDSKYMEVNLEEKTSGIQKRRKL